MNATRSLRWVGQLIYKDFYVLRGSMLFVGVLGLVVPFLTTRLDQGWLFLGMWTGLTGYFFAISSCTYEETVGGWRWMRTLPVSARTIMLAKYAANLLFALVSSGVLTLIGQVMASRGWLPAPAVPVYYYTFFPMPMVLVFGGLVMWLSVAWDFRRAQIAFYVFMLAIMLLPGFGKLFGADRPRWAEQWATGDLHFHLTTASWLFLAGLLALYAVFGLLAARAFARRDL
ncbi:MAG TPA: ABC-2 transporter permease [Symbiobacteriaceae bacterium]|nr:ABC-2 transporter permease [Symbiobacteriaceae bacterium]